MAGTISSADLHKIQRYNTGDDMKDMITDLPEGIPLHILSFLPTKDTVRTSILAKKWRDLWTYLSVFDFETGHPQYESNHQNQNSVNCFLDLVGKPLQKSNCVERLSIDIFEITVDADKVFSIISSASKHKLKYLKVSLGVATDKFVLPYSISAFESLNELCLGLKFTLDIPSGILFPSLKTLVVSEVTFANENSVQNLFSGCPVLQELELNEFYWKNIEQINVAISTLRKLTIIFYMVSVHYDHDMTLKIDAVNLLSLSVRCSPTIEFIPVNLSSLVDADIGLWQVCRNSESYVAHCAFELLRGINSIKSLTISVCTLKCLYHTKDTLHLLPSFHNLTHLYVDPLGSPTNTNEVLLDILRKTPKLEVLTIPGVVLNYLDDEDLILNSVPFKYSFNRLCILNFNGDESEVQFIVFVLNKAPYLAEIQIHFSTHLLADMEKMTNVCNQLKDLGLERCYFKFLCNYFEPSRNEDNED